jgi:hypothetical protein
MASTKNNLKKSIKESTKKLSEHKLTKKLIKLIKELWPQESTLRKRLENLIYEEIIKKKLGYISIISYIITNCGIEKMNETIPGEEDTDIDYIELYENFIEECREQIFREKMFENHDDVYGFLINKFIVFINDKLNWPKKTAEIFINEAIDLFKKNFKEIRSSLSFRDTVDKFDRLWKNEETKFFDTSDSKKFNEDSQNTYGMMGDTYGANKKKLGETDIYKDGKLISKGYSSEKRTKNLSEKDDKILNHMMNNLKQKKYMIPESKIKKIWNIVLEQNNGIDTKKKLLSEKHRYFFMAYIIKLFNNSIPYDDLYTAVFDANFEIEKKPCILSNQFYKNNTICKPISSKFDIIFSFLGKEYMDDDLKLIKQNHMNNKEYKYDINRLDKVKFFKKKRSDDNLVQISNKDFINEIKKEYLKNSGKLNKILYEILKKKYNISHFEKDGKSIKVTNDNIKILTESLISN